MPKEMFSVTLQTADKTRKARITVTREMTVSDIVKVSRQKWSLGLGTEFQVFNLTNGRHLLAHDWLTEENIKQGDTLMLQPIATHG